MQNYFSKKFFILLVVVSAIFVGFYLVGLELTQRTFPPQTPPSSTIIIEFTPGITEEEIAEIILSIHGRTTMSPYSLSLHERAIELPVSNPMPILTELKERYAPKVKDAYLQLTPLRPAT